MYVGLCLIPILALHGKLWTMSPLLQCAKHLACVFRAVTTFDLLWADCSDFNRVSNDPILCRESGFVNSLPQLLKLQQADGNIPRQTACNLLCTLQTVQLLLGSPLAAGGSATDKASSTAKETDENRAACQAALLRAGVMPILIGAPLGDAAIASVTVRIQVQCVHNHHSQ